MHKNMVFRTATKDWDGRKTTQWSVMPESREGTVLGLTHNHEVLVVRALLAMQQELACIPGPRYTPQLKAERMRVDDLLDRLGVVNS